LTRSKANAEDILQDVFLKAYQKHAEIREIRSWLYRTARNQFIDTKRDANRSPVLQGGDLELLDTVGTSDTPELTHDLEKGISKLTERERQVFILHDIKGLSSQAITDILTIAPSTVRNTLINARTRLVAFLRPQK
jgi:RNA polymerase sigma-70 factor (ECF subfamily)